MNDDPFQDVRTQLAGYGVLSGPGADQHHSARQSQDKFGAVYVLSCDRCGTVNRLTVEWAELVYGAHRQLPPRWQYDAHNGGLTPPMGCVQCREVLRIRLLPDECARQIKAGLHANLVRQDQIAQIEQHIRSRSGR
jgi:hypothetical protein